MLANTQVGRLQRKLGSAERQADKIPDIQPNLDAFDSIDEYLKVKIHGMEIYVRFYADGKTIPVNADELKKRKIIPIRVAGDQ